MTTNTENTDQIQDQDQEMVSIDTVDQFAQILEGWLKNTHATYEHFYNIPEGTTATLPDGTEVDLVGDVLNAFKLGILFAKEQLNTVPIVIETVENTETPDQA